MKDISSLPDYTALKKLASALWQQESSYHGAAVMVGAGFSRSAASTGDIAKKLPLWNDFSKTLANELGSNSTDPLRLAEEYYAYFGKQALHDLIKNKVNDTAWIPGALHKSLLELPWSEVMTTNWDTLLERASSEVHKPIYDIVSKQEDLSSARSPRIVKLHGTIDITKDLIFTQEDYRRYPQQNAAFVNFSRQVFIENELCLLGFSGDDPNFLQWAGWVRDHLATHSRRIYLVGALELNSAKRKYLESINIAPIDLNDLVKDHEEHDIRHLEATKLFIQALQKLKPKYAWEWDPTNLHRTTITGVESERVHQDADYAAKLLEEKLPLLEKDRLSYPDWLICPYRQRFSLQMQISDPWPNYKNLSAMTENSRAKILYEIAWHYQTTFEAVQPWLANELLTVCNTETTCSLSKKQQMQIALLLLKNTRWMENPDSQKIYQTTKSILEKGQKYWPESSNELAYHDAIIARDNLDYSTLEKLTEKIITSNPVWKLRKASLLSELGQFDKGRKLVEDAYKELLNQHRNDRNSIHVLSRLAWANWVIRGVDLSSSDKKFKAFPSQYSDAKCDPWDHIEHVRDRIFDLLNKQQEQKGIEPSFEPGRYKENKNRVIFSNEVHPLLLIEGIFNTVGMPLRWNGVNFFSDQAANIAQLEEIENTHRFALAIRSAKTETDKVLEQVFSRTNVACFSNDDVNFLLKQCREAIDYWLAKRGIKSSDVSKFAIERLRVFIEVLSRVSVRATPEQAKEIFHLAVFLGKKPELHHIWLFDTVMHLTKFSLESIPESQQKDVLISALSFPLQSEINIGCHERWANPVVKHPGERKQDSALDRRIDEIIENIAPCSPQSAPALLRLLPLIENNFLTHEELNKISKNIWGTEATLEKLPETGLLKYALLKTPSPDTSAARILVRKYLFEAKGQFLLDSELLMDIASAAQAKNIKEFPLKDQASAYFKEIVSWRSKKDVDDMLGFSRNEERQLTKLASEVLARSVVPSLPSEELNLENFEKLVAFYTETETPETLIAFSYFAIANEKLIESVEKIIRQGLQSDNADKIAYASYALLIWREQKEIPSIDRLISRLIYLIGASRILGLPGLLWTANQMYCKQYLSSESIESLIEILPIIFDNATYRNTSFSKRESISISLVRAACIRLARDINLKNASRNEELLRILEEAKKDSLPEVRFAEMTNV